jgi:septum formation inhibitor-activating ATPase MinD
VVLVSRVAVPDPMGLTDVSVYLGVEITGTVPPASELCLTAQRRGEPVVIAHPRSVVAANLVEMATRIAGTRARIT